MSVALPEQPSATVINVPTDEQLIRRRITAAQDYRAPFESGWLVALAFVAGQQWIVWDRLSRKLLDIRETPDGEKYGDTDLYVADIIHEHRGAALGELQTDSDRPELLLPGDGDEDAESEDVAKAANRALGHLWDFEAETDKQLRMSRQYCVDLGVAAIRVSFDRRAGDAVKTSTGDQLEAPVGADGRAIVDPAQAREYVAGLAEKQQTASFEPQYQGRIRHEPGTAFNLLTPPGVPHEDQFPWEVWVAPVLLDDVKAEYPGARDMQPDADIGSALGVSVTQAAPNGTRSQTPHLADSVWFFWYYQRPSKRYPKGRTAYLAGAQKKLLKVEEQLPYQRTNGDWCSGIVYYHWQRLTDRFYSRSLIDALKDPQRMINRVETQNQEIIDRGMPYTIIEEGTLKQKPTGKVREYVELLKGTTVQPKDVPGTGPGDWMYKQIEQLRDDAAHASTLSALKLGENPTQVSTYGQLALLQEQEASKRSSIRNDHQSQDVTLAELSMIDIRRYWPDGKKLLVQGDQNSLQAATYEKASIPDDYVVRPAKGAPKPRGQAAQITLIGDTWAAAVASQAAIADSSRWLKWFYESNEAGSPLPIPEPPSDAWSDKAEYENRALERGEDVYPPTYYDPPTTHIPLHRRAQDEALMRHEQDSMDVWQRIEAHIQEHLKVATQNQPQPLAAVGAPGVQPAAALPPGADPSAAPVDPSTQGLAQTSAPVAAPQTGPFPPQA